MADESLDRNVTSDAGRPEYPADGSDPAVRTRRPWTLRHVATIFIVFAAGAVAVAGYQAVHPVIAWLNRLSTVPAGLLATRDAIERFSFPLFSALILITVVGWFSSIKGVRRVAQATTVLFVLAVLIYVVPFGLGFSSYLLAPVAGFWAAALFNVLGRSLWRSSTDRALRFGAWLSAAGFVAAVHQFILFSKLVSVWWAMAMSDLPK